MTGVQRERKVWLTSGNKSSPHLHYPCNILPLYCQNHNQTNILPTSGFHHQAVTTPRLRLLWLSPVRMLRQSCMPHPLQFLLFQPGSRQEMDFQGVPAEPSVLTQV